MKLHFLATATLAGSLFVAPSLSSVAFAQSAPAAATWAVGSLSISGAFARATLPHAPVGGGYLTITNSGSTDDMLVSVTSPLAGVVTLHDMGVTDGVMKMRDLPDGVPIPAGKTVTFAPSGLHMMFMQLKGAFVTGKTVPVTLTFAKAGTVTVELAVGGIAAKAPVANDAMSGMQM